MRTLARSGRPLPSALLSSALLTAALLAGLARTAAAEPYLAVREGYTCSTCHTSPGGGGMRNAFGNVYAQQQLPANPPADAEMWNGTFLSRFSVGANARVDATLNDQDEQDDHVDFGVERVAVYGGARLNEHVSLYVDQRLAPGRSTNREAWIRLDWGRTYLRAGRLFLPFGWRLEDNAALTRQQTGITMDQGDDGVEVGYVSGSVDFSLAVANGSGGGAEVDDGKLFSSRLAWVQRRFQIGVSAYHNDTDVVDRTMGGVFAGLDTGPLTWLAEYDWIDDDAQTDALADAQSEAGLLELDWRIARGHNVKLTAELIRFDGDAEDQLRGSVVYELFPWTFTQLRVGARVRDSDDPEPRLSANEAFVELHAFF